MKPVPLGKAIISINILNDTNTTNLYQISFQAQEFKGIHFGREQEI